LKITGIETFLMQVGGPRAARTSDGRDYFEGGNFGGSRNWLFVRITTDDGSHGVGECSGWPRVIETAIQDLAPMLIGEDPGHIDRLWHKMFAAMMGHGMLGTVGGGALTGIEMALWDIKGKALGQPVWNLLGGRFRDKVRVYGHATDSQKADRLTALGYTGIKVGFTGIVDLDLVARIRDHVGPKVDLMVDAHGPSWMTAADAIAVGRELESLDLLFYEDPVAPEDLDALARVRDGVSVPLAAGERVSTIWGIQPYIDRGLVDVIQPDTGRAGGITQMRKMAAMAEGHYITMAPHSGSLGPVAEYAALHVMATIPNALMLERVEFDWEGRNHVITPTLRVVDGHLKVPDTPGLGVDIVVEEIEKYPSRRNVRDISAEDGTAYAAGTATELPYFQTRFERRLTLRRSR
jgi:galactonate dehydratase